MTGLLRIIALQWRTSWGMLLATPVALAALVTAIGASMGELYPTAAQRATYAATMGSSPAAQAFNGRGYDLDQLGGIAAYEVGFMGQLAVPVLGLLMAIRLTRRLEDQGILELVNATRVSRTTVPVAAAVSCKVAWLLFVALGTAGLAAFDYPWLHSLRYLAVLGAFGLAFSALGLLAAQIFSTSRAATALALVGVLAAFLVRATVDGRNWDAAWASPMGWVAEAHPWGQWQWWPLVALLALGAVSAVAALAIAGRRDLGQGILTQRLGRATAGRWLAEPVCLVWRLCRGGILGWLAGAMVWAAAIGLMSQEFVDVVRANPSLEQAFGEAEHLSSGLALTLVVTIAAAAGVGVALRMGAEEQSTRLGLLLAGRRTRWQWWAAFTGVGIATSATVLLAGAAALGAAQARVMHRGESLDEALQAGAELLAPCLAMVALAALLVALAPRLRVVAWLPVAWTMVVGLLAEPLRLPQWARDLSPAHLVGNVPLETADGTAIVGLAVVGVALLVASPLAFNRRDLQQD